MWGLIGLRDLKNLRNLMKCNKSKCKLQPLKQENHHALTQAGGQQLEISIAEKDSGVLVQNKSSKNQQ